MHRPMPRPATSYADTGIVPVDRRLRRVRSRLVNASLIAVCVFALPAVIGVLVRVADLGVRLENYLHVAAYLCLVGVTLLRHRLPFQARALILLGLWFAVGVASLFMWGLAGNGIPFLITGCLFTTLLLGMRNGALSAVATLALMTTVWLTVDHGAAARQADLVTYLSSDAAWVVRILVCGMVMAIIMASLNKLHHAMATTAAELQHRSADLEQINQRLETEIEDRRRIQQSLSESEAKYRSLHENIPVGVYRTTPDGQFLSVNPAMVALSGYDTPDELMRFNAADLYADAEERAALVADIQRDGAVREREVQFRLRDGSVVWASISARCATDADGRPLYLDGIIQDITERKAMAQALKRAHDDLEARVATRTRELTLAYENLEILNADLESAIQQANQIAADAEIRNYELEISMQKRRRAESALRESERKYRSIIETINEGYWEIDPDGSVVFLNDAVCEILGYSRGELMGMNTAALVDASTIERVRNDFGRVLSTGTPLSGYRYVIRQKDGRRRQVESSMAPVRSEDGEIVGLRGILRDIEALKKHEDQLIYQAYHDALTGLWNRKAFYERLDEAAAFARRYDRPFSLVYIDIDRFKQANDTLGHEAGDAILQEVSRRLQRCMRETDVVSRLGGDEFAVILTNPDAGAPDAVARRIVETLSAPYPVHGGMVDTISASVGISRYPDDTTDAGQLVTYADAAMYAAKKRRNRHMHYDAIAASAAPA